VLGQGRLGGGDLVLPQQVDEKRVVHSPTLPRTAITLGRYHSLQDRQTC
jgi:hypothetical protein